jgi:MFS family permease
VLAVLVFAGIIEIWMLYPIAVLEGITAAVAQPARQVMVYDVVENDDLANAVAINSLGSNTMRIIGPATAGALIGVAGVESAFLLQAVAYALSVWFTSLIRTPGEPTGAVTTSVLRSMADGISYARSHPEVRALVAMAAIPAVFVYPYVQYMAVFADDVLGVSSVGFGFLASAVGYGSIIGAVLAANLTGIRRRGLVLVWTTLIYQALIVVFALSNSFALSIAVLVSPASPTRRT